MKVKYLGESDPLALLNGKVYDVISVESKWYRIVDETEEDYLYPPGAFEIVEESNNITIIFILFMAISIFTGLVTEALKKVLDECGKVYKSNILAGVVAIVLSVGVGEGYMIMTETALNDKMAVVLIALVLLSWLASMVGYDKVMQAISQIKYAKIRRK